MKLHFDIKNQTLERKDDQILASFSKNFIRCQFKCECPWHNIYKYALFTDVRNQKTIVDLGYGKKVSCRIPENVLKNNFFLVSVFGDNRLTTNQVNVLVEPSGFSDAVETLMDSQDISDSDILTTNADAVDSDIKRLVSCYHGYTILKDPQHDEHLYF